MAYTSAVAAIECVDYITNPNICSRTSPQVLIVRPRRDRLKKEGKTQQHERVPPQTYRHNLNAVRVPFIKYYALY